MKTDAHPRCGTGDSGVQSSEKSTHEPGKRKETYRLLPTSVISFNAAEDIEGE
jgi:hypothetical protein